jgi:hypothetical protein
MLHGKLTREEEGMEDLLTSNTFGLMTYLPPDALLLLFLSEACSPSLDKLPAQFCADVIEIERWHFWPPLQYPGCAFCEPDVVLILRHRDGSRTGVLIEVKYRSGMSSLASDVDERPKAQLAREYDNLRALARDEGLARFAVIYLTTDCVCPREEVEESVEEYRNKRGHLPEIYWLSWRTLAALLQRKGAERTPIMEDLYALFLHLDLTTFCQLRYPGLGMPSWRFAVDVRWVWSIPNIAWSFAIPGQAIEPRFGWMLPTSLSHLYQWRRS